MLKWNKLILNRDCGLDLMFLMRKQQQHAERTQRHPGYSEGRNTSVAHQKLSELF